MSEHHISNTAQPDFRDLLADIWADRKIILMASLAGLLIALSFIALARPQYEGQMLLVPANPMNGAETSSMLADENVYALRYLAQRLGSSAVSDFERFKSTFAGPSVAKKLLNDKAILKGLAVDRAFVFSAPLDQPSPEMLSRYLQKRVKLEPISGSQVSALSYFHENPAFARYMIAAIHAAADHLIRDSVRQDSTARIEYLQKAIFETNNPEHRRALTTLLLEQERLKMLASIEQPYAAAIIEPAATSDKPAWPDFYMVIGGLMMTGAFAGYLVHALRRPSPIMTARRSRFSWHKINARNSNRADPSVRAAE